MRFRVMLLAGLVTSVAFAGARYDASLGTLPQAQGFIYSGASNVNGTNPSPFVAGGALQENTTVGAQYWDITDASINFAQNAVIEANLHIISSNYIANIGTGTREGYYLGISESGHSYSVGLTAAGFNINSIEVPNQPLTPYPFPITDTFHVYHLSIANGLASFSIDGKVVASSIAPTADAEIGPPESVIFGAVGGASRSLTELKSFCYGTTASACGCQVTVSPYGGGVYSLDHQPTTMLATFVPTDAGGLPAGITVAAKDCGFTGFNWQQLITRQDALEEIKLEAPGLAIGNGIQLGNLSADNSLQAPPSYSDPPLGGYLYEQQFDDAYPFYWNASELANPAILTPFTLLFSDSPNTLVEKDFTTSLVGVLASGIASKPLFTWQWRTTYTGTIADGGRDTGGIIQNKSTFALNPGGTGGVTITSINGVQLPPVVRPGLVATTASGLAYSRVSQTFTGTVTLKNISGSPISGPLQILFFGMPANVTLVNATANLSGTPYLTVPATASLAPGQSVTVSVQLKNPSNATINFTPVIYSGSIN